MAKLVLGDTPTFKGAKELARYIDPSERLNDKHAAVSAFLPTEEDLQNRHTAHLSVNSTEVESRKAIADYSRAVWQEDEGDVALYINKVQAYVDCGRNSDVAIRSSSGGPSWIFQSEKGEEEAFRHRPVPPVRNTGRPGSPSHSGIEFIRAMNETQLRKFARRLARKPRYHIYK